jgi:hypothetical protein
MIANRLIWLNNLRLRLNVLKNSFVTRTTMTDFRALCAELLDELDFQSSHHSAVDLKARARAALAQPEPQMPTDEELYDLFDWLKDEWQSNNEREFPLPVFARAVLARWGNQ